MKTLAEHRTNLRVLVDRLETSLREANPRLPNHASIPTLSQVETDAQTLVNAFRVVDAAEQDKRHALAYALVGLAGDL